jgi:hypothetical protein
LFQRFKSLTYIGAEQHLLQQCKAEARKLVLVIIQEATDEY